MRVALVLGKKPRPIDWIHPELKARAEMAAQLLFRKEVDLVIISGGPTVQDKPSEASTAFMSTPALWGEHVLLEVSSKTTEENIKNTRKMFEDIYVLEIKSMFIITSPGHIKRTRWLIEKYWPEILPAVEFLPVGDFRTMDVVTEWMQLTLAKSKVGQKIILPILRKIFRNG